MDVPKWCQDAADEILAALPEIQSLALLAQATAAAEHPDPDPDAGGRYARDRVARIVFAHRERDKWDATRKAFGPPASEADQTPCKPSGEVAGLAHAAGLEIAGLPGRTWFFVRQGVLVGKYDPAKRTYETASEPGGFFSTSPAQAVALAAADADRLMGRRSQTQSLPGDAPR